LPQITRINTNNIYHVNTEIFKITIGLMIFLNTKAGEIFVLHIFNN